VSNKAETVKAVEVDGFFNAEDRAGFVLIKRRSISKMSGCSETFSLSGAGSFRGAFLAIA
jgi:hypothetical protein